MYRHCIYCSAPFGANETLERFPVGRMLAFDAAKGRLWAVCGRCARWNLSPIEERWEAVEDAERAFRGTRLRVQSENVGMAKLADGTRLVRVGAALPGEVAAWRYGSQLRGRRKAYLVVTGIVAAGVLVSSGLTLAGVITSGLGSVWGWKSLLDIQQASRVVDRDAGGAVLRRRDLNGAWMEPAGGDGGVRLVLPRVFVPGTTVPRRMEVEGPEALQLLGKAMIVVNRRGASDAELRAAFDAMAAAPGGDMLRHAAASNGRLGIQLTHWREPAFGGRSKAAEPGTQGLIAHELLALEMALHEEQERRAMEGELALLEAAWRDAEHIASIADGLAGDVPPRPGLTEG